MIPLIIFLALFLFIKEGRPVFFLQKRVGMNGKIFNYPEYKLDTVFKEAIYFHIRGMVNKSGLDYFTERLKKH